METMIQPKVTGYRQLSEAEVALMNEGKALAEVCGATGRLIEAFALVVEAAERERLASTLGHNVEKRDEI